MSRNFFHLQEGLWVACMSKKSGWKPRNKLTHDTNKQWVYKSSIIVTALYLSNQFLTVEIK